jgi:hypothetical protein
LNIQGTKEEGNRVLLKDFTVSGARYDSGLTVFNGLSFLCERMTFTQCDSGVNAMETKGRLINCVITQCGYSGIVCSYNALIDVEGSQTNIDGNCVDISFVEQCFGLSTDSTSSKIHLLFPLTKESVSTNNNGCENYGGKGEIAIVDNDGNRIEIINEAHACDY